MIRYVALLKRRSGLSHDQFLDRWLGEHQALALEMPRVRRVQFHPAVIVEGSPQQFDGIGYLDFDSLEDLEMSLASEHALKVRAHTATFADSESVVRVVVNTSSMARNPFNDSSRDD